MLALWLANSWRLLNLLRQYSSEKGAPTEWSTRNTAAQSRLCLRNFNLEPIRNQLKLRVEVFYCNLMKRTVEPLLTPKIGKIVDKMTVRRLSGLSKILLFLFCSIPKYFKKFFMKICCFFDNNFSVLVETCNKGFWSHVFCWLRQYLCFVVPAILQHESYDVRVAFGNEHMSGNGFNVTGKSSLSDLLEFVRISICCLD